MKYQRIKEGRFISRPNRFIANVETEDGVQVCHVKNTGRCRELLVPGARVWLEEAAPGAVRKTGYDLVSVEREGYIVNMDSQAPNKLFGEWAAGNIPGLEEIKPEQKYGNSRFDFFMRVKGRPVYTEIKGVTLREENRALFPDAPTERGVKHILELIEAVKNGCGACLFFVIQMKGTDVFMPNRRTQPEFAEALTEAREAGVSLAAYDCRVTPDTVLIDRPVSIDLDYGRQLK